MDAKVKKSSSSALKLSDKCQLSRFSDYFVICGLDLENGLEADLYTGEFVDFLWNPSMRVLGVFEQRILELWEFQPPFRVLVGARRSVGSL